MQTDLSYTIGQGFIDVPFATIPDLVRKHAEHSPSTVAQVSVDWETNDKESLTFKELYERASKFAVGIKYLGVQKGDVVAIGTDNCKEWMTATIGSIMSGAVCLFFYFDRNDGEDLKALLQKVGDKCRAIIFPKGKNDAYLPIIDRVLTKHNTKGKVSCETAISLEIAIVMSERQHPEFLNLLDVTEVKITDCELPELEPEDLVGIFLTSGTTGEPKLVQHSHYSMLLAGFQFSVGYGRSSRQIFNDRPFNWMVGSPTWEILTGGTRVYIKHVAFIPSFNEYVVTVRNILQGLPCDSYMLIPAVLNELTQDESSRWNLKTIATAGQPILSSMMKSVSRICRKFSILYGSTEVLTSTCHFCEKGGEYPDFIVGKPFPGVEIKVVDENGSILKRGKRGEAYVRSMNIFRGYLKNYQSTASALTNTGWYKTDDSAIMLEDGNLVVEGRRSECLLRSGARFITMSLASIEAALKQHSLVKDAVVIPLLLEEDFPTITCAVILRQEMDVDKNQLKEFLLDPNGYTGSLFREIDVPKSFIFLKEFPKTFNGKVKRKELADLCRKKMKDSIVEE